MNDGLLIPPLILVPETVLGAAEEALPLTPWEVITVLKVVSLQVAEDKTLETDVARLEPVDDVGPAELVSLHDDVSGSRVDVLDPSVQVVSRGAVAVIGLLLLVVMPPVLEVGPEG